MIRSKKGTTTLFLAIVLSALILVETTYISFVADLDRRLTYARALQEQTEVYLASYNRLLFKTYGIYAFNADALDSSLFDEILAANGYEAGDTMFVSGMYSLDTDMLKRAVAVYYSYRTSGILTDRFSSQIFALLEQLSGYDIRGLLGQYVSSPSSGILATVIGGGASIAETVSSAVVSLGLEDSDAITRFNSLMSSLGAARNSSPDIANGFDPADMGFLFNSIGFMYDFHNILSGFNENTGIHFCLSDYAANNFDCFMEDDTSINGTSFETFHINNEYDSEYILTGLTGGLALALTDYYIFSALLIKNIAKILLDSSKRETIEVTGEILAAVVTALTAGTMALPPEVYEAVIIAIMAVVESLTDLVSVLNGESVTFLQIGDIDAISMNYRDFISLFMAVVPDDILSSRMLSVIDRDFPNHMTGLAAEVQYRTDTLIYEASYELYS